VSLLLNARLSALAWLEDEQIHLLYFKLRSQETLDAQQAGGLSIGS